MRALQGGEPGFRAGASGGRESGVASAGARRARACGSKNEETAATVDLANTAYMLMLRLISHSYLLPRPHPAKALCVDLALGLMRAMAPLGRTRRAFAGGPVESRMQRRHVIHRAARRRADCRPASVPASFSSSGCEELTRRRRRWRRRTAMRAWRRRSKVLTDLTQRAERNVREHRKRRASGVAAGADASARAGRRCPRRAAAAGGAAVIEPGNVAPTPRTVDGVDYIEGRDLTLIYEGKKCIHSRFCVTWGPKVFIANVKGPWINPDAMPTDALTEIAHVCVSGAIRYKRKDGQPDEGRRR